MDCTPKLFPIAPPSGSTSALGIYRKLLLWTLQKTPSVSILAYSGPWRVTLTLILRIFTFQDILVLGVVPLISASDPYMFPVYTRVKELSSGLLEGYTNASNISKEELILLFPVTMMVYGIHLWFLFHKHDNYWCDMWCNNQWCRNRMSGRHCLMTDISRIKCFCIAQSEQLMKSWGYNVIFAITNVLVGI